MTHSSPLQPHHDRSTRRRRDPQGTRDRLVRAALELFTTDGFHASTTPRIARKAGVAEGTIYRHFASKQHLLNELYRTAVSMFSSVVEEAVQEKTTCRVTMQRVAVQWAEIAERDPEVVKLVFVSPLISALDPRSQTARQDLRAALESLLASGKSAGEVRPGPVEVWADVWIQLIELVLERVADGTWSLEQSAAHQVIQCAWDAVGNILAT